jgi:hypothetical protein
MTSRVIRSKISFSANASFFQANQSAIALESKNPSFSDRTRHIAIRYYWLKDRINSGDIEIIFKPTSEMIADILTKPIQGKKFINLRKLLLNWKF